MEEDPRVLGNIRAGFRPLFLVRRSTHSGQDPRGPRGREKWLALCGTHSYNFGPVPTIHSYSFTVDNFNSLSFGVKKPSRRKDSTASGTRLLGRTDIPTSPSLLPRKLLGFFHSSSSSGQAANMAIYSTGPRSAFSDSSSSSLVARPTDKSFLKRWFNRGKPRAATIPISHSTFDLSEKYARHENNFFALPPSPHTHPLLSKPYARDELRPRSSTNHLRPDGSIVAGGDGSAHARKVAAMRPAGRSVDSGVSPEREREVNARGIREREKAAREAAVEGRYVQEWGFFIKCYAEGRFNVSNPPDPPPRRPDFDHLTAPLPPNEKQRLEVCILGQL